MTPDTTAQMIVNGDLGRKDMTFSQFRTAMLDQHPDYLDDNTIYDLYQKHVKQVVLVIDEEARDELLGVLDKMKAEDERYQAEVDARRKVFEVEKSQKAQRAAMPKPIPKTTSRKRNKRGKKKWWRR